MPHSRAVADVAGCAAELRLRGEEGIHGAFRYAAFERGILVFHAFAKKTQPTQPREIELAKKHLREILDESDRTGRRENA